MKQAFGILGRFFLSFIEGINDVGIGDDRDVKAPVFGISVRFCCPELWAERDACGESTQGCELTAVQGIGLLSNEIVEWIYAGDASSRKPMKAKREPRPRPN